MEVAVEGHVAHPFTLEQACGGFTALFAVRSIIKSKRPMDMVIFYGMDCMARIACIDNYALIPDSMRRFLDIDVTNPVIAFYSNVPRLPLFAQLFSYMAHALVKDRVHRVPLPQSLVYAFPIKNSTRLVASTFVRDFNLDSDNTYLIFAYMCRRKSQTSAGYANATTIMTQKTLKHTFKNDPWSDHDYFRSLFRHMQLYVQTMGREYWISVRKSARVKATNGRIMWQLNSDYFEDWLKDEHNFCFDTMQSPKKLVNAVIMLWLQDRYGGGLNMADLARTLECVPNSQPQTKRLKNDTVA